MKHKWIWFMFLLWIWFTKIWFMFLFWIWSKISLVTLTKINPLCSDLEIIHKEARSEHCSHPINNLMMGYWVFSCARFLIIFYWEYISEIMLFLIGFHSKTHIDNLWFTFLHVFLWLQWVYVHAITFISWYFCFMATLSQATWGLFICGFIWITYLRFSTWRKTKWYHKNPIYEWFWWSFVFFFSLVWVIIFLLVPKSII